MGSCPYPVAQSVFTSPGEGEGEEGVAEEEEDGAVVVAIVDKDDEPVEVIPMRESTPPQDPATVSEPPPLRSPIGGRILCRFTHLTKPSRPGHHPGAWDLPQ
jgi:hypothetical protein